MKLIRTLYLLAAISAFAAAFTTPTPVARATGTIAGADPTDGGYTPCNCICLTWWGKKYCACVCQNN